jgi:hypothetical protein
LPNVHGTISCLSAFHITDRTFASSWMIRREMQIIFVVEHYTGVFWVPYEAWTRMHRKRRRSTRFRSMATQVVAGSTWAWGPVFMILLNRN